MRRHLGLCVALGAVSALGVPSAATAQRVVVDDPWCDAEWHGQNADRYCEVREFTLPAGRSVIDVDGRANGGIRVVGWDRDEIFVRAKVQAWSRYDNPASRAGEIRIDLDGTIRADGPRTGRREGWSVSYEIMAPRASNFSLETVNGSIRIEDVHGDLNFRATNGSITLEEVGGRVRGRTTNGGVRVALSGSEWSGDGLDVVTTNGGVTLDIPDQYRATLESGTVNGGFRIDFPIVVQGRLSHRRLTTDLNGGGRLIRAVTTNGSVVIRRR
jgi:hypothetical protein